MLRLLIVDANSQESGPSSLALEGTATVIATSLAEAEEALGLQCFDAVLLRKPEPRENLAEFVRRLREREAAGKVRTPVLLADSETQQNLPGIDALLLEQFDLATLQATLERLKQASYGVGAGTALGNGPPGPGLPRFDAEGFAAHLGNDASLIVEIIDLFFDECGQQLPELRDLLASTDYERVSRIAHTLKGSLSSLQAPYSRLQAHRLEEAAKQHDAYGCTAAMQALEESIEAMRPELLKLRQRSAGLL
ncbi:MAG TPA: response regulator [Bryobacteraceae bacterium]|jgi:HPt (histidine-containing phosphotransfer) domain-containing protein/CheY-like chemotaxis protein|nr:response regulator [Bryobacteraceae bacterium]